MRPFFRRGTGNMKSDHETRMHVAASTKNRRNSRGNGFRFIFFFAFRVYFPRSVFHFSTLPLSFSLSLFNPPPLTLTLRSFPTLALVFTPTPFTPELLPLMNRGGITRCTRGANGAAASAGWKDRESGGARGRRRRRDSKLSRRYLRAYNEEGRGFIRGDSFSNFCPALILLFLVVSRLDVARKKKGLEGSNEIRRVTFQIMIMRAMNCISKYPGILNLTVKGSSSVSIK